MTDAVPITPVLITDASDPRLADLVGLRDRELRTRSGAAHGETGVFVAEGDHVVERALRAGYRMVSSLIDATRSAPLPYEVPADAALYAAGPEVVLAITGFGVHRGSVAVFERRELASLDEVLDGAKRIVLLERVVNPINLGVIVRSAAALGIDALILDESSVDPLYRRASRVAMGEVFGLPYTRIGALPGSAEMLSDRGFTLVALTPDDDAQPIDEIRLRPGERVALVLGSEGPGLSPETLAACARRVRIPLVGGVDSLNVGAAAAVAFYAIGRA